MKKFCRANWSVQQAIQKRVEVEDMQAWGQKPTPKWRPMKDTTDYGSPRPSILALYRLFGS